MTELKKQLSVSGLTMIVIGACIGSGIFITPASSFENTPNYLYVILAWIIGGFVTFLGAMTFSELGAKHPKAGGVYVFLKEAYGDLVGFLYGWIILLIVNTGALAALSIAFADYLSFFIHVSEGSKQTIAIITIIVLTGINIIGVDISELFAKLFSSLKLIALGAIILVGLVFLMDQGVSDNAIANPIPTSENSLLSLMLLTFVGVFWSYGGWHHVTYLAGETKEPRKTIPRAMLYGTLIVTFVYICVITAYALLLPMDTLSTSTKVAGDAVAQYISGGGKLVTIAISISIFGTIGIYTMSAPRIYYAMSRDRIFFSFLSDLHKRFKTPYKAMIFQAVWAIVLILIWGTFVKLITFVTFMDIVFMALASATIFIFRNREKKGEKHEGNFRLKQYPIIPIIYLLVTVAFVINTMFVLQEESLAGILILILGIPVFYFFKKRRKG